MRADGACLIKSLAVCLGGDLLAFALPAPYESHLLFKDVLLFSCSNSSSSVLYLNQSDTCSYEAHTHYTRWPRCCCLCRPGELGQREA